MKSLLKQIGDFVSPNDPELVEKTLTRLQRQDEYNDVFSTHLIDLLTTNDKLKAEARMAGVALDSAKAEGLAARDAFDEAKAEAQKSIAALKEARAGADFAAAALVGAKSLTMQAEGHLAEARKLAATAAADWQRVSLRAEDAVAAHARASGLYRRFTSLLIVAFALLSVSVMLAQGFWGISSPQRAGVSVFCGLIVAVSAVLLWRMRRES